MDVIKLPRLDEDRTLNDAIDAMIAADCRAVVVERPTTGLFGTLGGLLHAKRPTPARLEIFTNVQVAHALDAGLERLSHLPPSGRVVIPAEGEAPGPPAPTRSIRGERELHGLDDNDRRALEEFMDARGAMFAYLERLEAGSLTILTRHEGHKYEIQKRERICRCRPNQHRPAAGSMPATGDPCDFGCGGVYRCF